jgi:prefoldin beta subunit
MDEKTQEKVRELQLVEQNLQQSLGQKQNFQGKLMEVDNALEELGKDPKEIYKIIGPIMVKAKKEEVEKDLGSKKEVYDLRVKNIEKNEEKIKEKAKILQESIMKELKDE